MGLFEQSLQKAESIIKVYLFSYFVILLIFFSLTPALPQGEWGGYMLSMVSVMQEHRISITPETILTTQMIFPEWEDDIQKYADTRLFDIPSRSGGRFSCYFPTYSIFCIPFTLLLKAMQLPAMYAFTYANIFILMLSLILVATKLHASITKRVVLMCLLSINPIIFYIGWQSAEVFMYAFIVMAMVAWYNQWDRYGALFLSIAATLNPTIMAIGIPIFFTYVYKWYMLKPCHETIVIYFKRCWKSLLIYSSCYLIGLIPMAYNYYNLNVINISSAYANSGGITIQAICERFLAYLLDLNFGILPYYPVLLGIFFLLIIVAVVKREQRYLTCAGAFILVVLSYSLVNHINCGMSGIARYNAWSVVVLIFAVVLFGDTVLRKCIRGYIINGVLNVFFAASIVYSGAVLLEYGPYCASKVGYTDMAPIAEWVLDNAPSRYNPLPSTFYSRVAHLDGGYNYITPIIYTNSMGEVKKVFASYENMNVLNDLLLAKNAHDMYFWNQLEKLQGKEAYIAIPKNHSMLWCPNYILGTLIYFDKMRFDEENNQKYVIAGIYPSEDWGAWTAGNQFHMRFKVDSNEEILTGIIECNIFNEQQRVQILVNDVIVYDEVVLEGNIKFMFKNPGPDEMVDLELYLPEATSPKNVKKGKDSRTIALGIKSMVFY